MATESPTIESLTKALEELRGFARRNSERALQYVKALEKTHLRSSDAQMRIELRGAYDRLHEAGRVEMVVCDRVDMALRGK